MRIGIYGGNVRRGRPLTSLVEEIIEKESEGFVSYWMPQVHMFDALTMIALAGQQTSTIELGTAVVPSYPRHPNALAQGARDSGGARTRCQALERGLAQHGGRDGDAYTVVDASADVDRTHSQPLGRSLHCFFL